MRGPNDERTVGRRLPPAMGLLCALVLAASAAAGEIYRYRRPDGVWVFTDDRRELPAEARPMEGAVEARPEVPRDLAGRLTRTLRPRGPVEAAVLATVAIRSSVGQGTGFFVTPDGFILTNRHVLRTPQDIRRERAARHAQLLERLGAVAEGLDEEQARLERSLAELERHRRQLVRGNYDENRRRLGRWQEDLDRRRAELDERLDELRAARAAAESRDRRADLDRAFDIRLADNTPLRAYLVAEADDLDLALLKVDGHLTPYLRAAAGRTAVGEPVYAIGNPAALRNSVSKGVLSGYEGGLIKTDAKVYPGNSGGPLVDVVGDVLGINTFKELTRRFEGLGFAIPIRTALEAFRADLPRGGRQ